MTRNEMMEEGRQENVLGGGGKKIYTYFYKLESENESRKCALFFSFLL